MKKNIFKIAATEYILVIIFGLFILISRIYDFKAAKIISGNFWLFFIEMITFLPLMFILVGLFDVWFPKEKVEKHIGEGSGLMGIVWVILLAMMQAGPLYGAFPVAYLLWKKGCSIKNVFIYLGAFSTLKIPMLTFEIGFLGLKFSLLRTVVTLPIFILIGYIMELYLKDKNFVINHPTLDKKETK
ncbi:MAG: permease [Candidatus Omnitrophica bacterium]|nr:permease [Candidatus Omnitrophota bacterium]